MIRYFYLFHRLPAFTMYRLTSFPTSGPQRRVPQLSGAPPSELELPPKAPLPTDLVATVLSVLHARASTAGVSQELSEAILTMAGNASQLLLGRPRQPPPGVARPPPTGPPRPPEQTPFGQAGLGSQVSGAHTVI